MAICILLLPKVISGSTKKKCHLFWVLPWAKYLSFHQKKEQPNSWKATLLPGTHKTQQPPLNILKGNLTNPQPSIVVKLKPKGATKINSSGDADLGSTINCSRSDRCRLVQGGEVNHNGWLRKVVVVVVVFLGTSGAKMAIYSRRFLDNKMIKVGWNWGWKFREC